LVVGIGLAGLFWQQNSTFQAFQANFLSLREHAEYEASTRRELDSAKEAADMRIAALQKQIDAITLTLSEQCKRSPMKYLDTEQPWPIIALLAILYVAIGVGVATLTSNIFILFVGGALFVVFGVRLIIWLG